MKAWLLGLVLVLLILTTGCVQQEDIFLLSRKDPCYNKEVGFTHFFIPENKFYSRSSFSGYINSIDSFEENGDKFNLLEIEGDRFLSDTNLNTTDGIKLKYLISGFNPDLLPTVNKGDKITHKVQCGFKCAAGVILSDSSGVKYIYDNGGYGMAFSEDDVSPFKFMPMDLGCRVNEHFNPFYLIISSGDSETKLLQGESGLINYKGDSYRAYVLRSYVKTSDAELSDVPWSSISYIIKRE